MSTYYSFYIGLRNIKTGVVRCIGPIVNDKRCAFYFRSRSFIDGDEVCDHMKKLSVDHMVKEDYSLLTYMNFHDEPISCAYYLPLSSVYRHVDYGLVKGYVTMEDMRYLDHNKYSEEALDSVDIISASVVAEMTDEERQQYHMIATVSTKTFGYICGLMSEIISDCEYIIDSDAEEYVMLCSVG